MKNKILFLIFFYFLSFTWALPTTLLGITVALGLFAAGKRPERFGPCLCFHIGNGWGFELGLFFIGDKGKSYELDCHEAGHQIQACLLGPFTLFVCTIPSIARYWLTEFESYKAKSIFVKLVVLGILLVDLSLLLLFSLFCSGCIIYIFVLLTIYIAFFGVWFLFELFKYRSRPYPEYDDFWVEGFATKSGLWMMKKFFN